LAITAGLRQGELLALKWEDVDLEGTNPALEVWRSLSETRGCRSFVTPKTCATLMLRQGVNPKFVQELLGHADISPTLNTYSHVLPDMGDAAAGGMDAALG
jgi:integrase